MGPSPLLRLAVLLLLLAASDSRRRSHGVCPPVEDSQPYMLTDLSGGLNNQKWEILTGLLFAQQRGLAYVVPPAIKLQLKPPYCEGFPEERPFSFLYDAEHMQQFGAERGIRIINTWNKTRQEACCAASRFNRFVSAPHDHRPGWCFDGMFTFYRIRRHLQLLLNTVTFELNPSLPMHFFYLANPHFIDMRDALAPSNLIKGALDNMISQFRALIGDPPYGVVHARLDKDFNPRQLVEAEIARRLLDSGKLPRGSKLQVCSTFQLSELPILCNAYRCFKLNQVPIPKEVFGHCSPQALPRDLIAYFDFYIALEASVFFGNFRSSFSIELYFEFLRRGKPAHFLNWNGTHEY